MDYVPDRINSDTALFNQRTNSARKSISTLLTTKLKDRDVRVETSNRVHCEKRLKDTVNTLVFP